MTPYAISRGSGGTMIVRDRGGIVATAEYELAVGQWLIEANRDRYRSAADLPALFDGKFRTHAERFRDLFDTFGCPLPGAAAIAHAKDEAA